ncbi:YtpI family protein [Bacillus marinisedimentorum]|uniref:YtpI family protein n=1 Tax=Bacillus marinisedimentorum TaxID=1821260 RepID=UPI0008734C46|nr:YtpI family protein [Bacillus marinisedimentorum]
MIILGALTVLAATLYIFYKAKAYRSKRPAEKQWVNAKARISLGLVLVFFGTDQLFLQRSTFALVIGVIFILLGGYYAWFGIREYRHFTPIALEEAEQLRYQSDS